MAKHWAWERTWNSQLLTQKVKRRLWGLVQILQYVEWEGCQYSQACLALASLLSSRAYNQLLAALLPLGTHGHLRITIRPPDLLLFPGHLILFLCSPSQWWQYLTSSYPGQEPTSHLGQRTFSIKSQMGNIWSLASHTVSVATIQPCHCRMKAVIRQHVASGWGCVPINLQLGALKSFHIIFIGSKMIHSFWFFPSYFKM